MVEVKLAHWPPLPDDPAQADAIRGMSRWTPEQRRAAVRKAYGPELAALMDKLSDMPDDLDKRLEVQAVLDKFGEIDHCKVFAAGLSAKI